MRESYYKNVSTSSINYTYNESLSYDKNGNITTLVRNGGIEVQNSTTQIDNMTYYYDPSIKNRLMKVIDATNNISGFDDDGTGTLASDPSNDYAYDANGNMTKDENKAITSITYNHLNLPVKITFSTGYTIEYLYDALGTKMKKTVTQGSTINTTEYLGEFQYLNGTLQFIQHAEGYVKYTAGGSSGFYNYVYHIKDHLGNIRVTFTKQLNNNTAKLLKENHYYPFGLKHPYNSTEFDYYYNTSTSSLTIGPMTNSNRYQYNSKEWQNELSLNLYDYGARMFDPAIGRWGVVDPLAEKYPGVSPYIYCFNNPINMVDLDGRDAIYIAFPKYRANGIPFTGHAGVLLIDNKTGVTKYYEYGRYDKENKGLVRTVAISNVVIGKDGKPTSESLNKVMKQLSNKSGHGGDIEGAYVISDKFKEMNDYAKSKMAENSDPNRKEYSITGNNCATFAEDVITQDKSVDKPSSVINSPVNIVDEYQEEGNAKVQYQAKTQTTKVGTGDENDAKVKVKK